ncbi:MAG: toxic anion resistance protein [Mucispirillum sp.]|nr:toxic anion resistance protein [Mucispirillum sp.]
MDKKETDVVNRAADTASSINRQLDEAAALPKFNMEPLSEEELKGIENYAASIDIHNSNTIISYGAGAQRKVAEFSEQALGSVTAKDLGEVGAALSKVISELKGFEIDNESSKGIFGFFKRSAKKGANKLTALKAGYEKAEANIEQVCAVLDKHQRTLLKDVAMLDKMYELNKNYFRELTMYIEAGKKKLDSIRNNELSDLRSKAQASGLPEDAQAVKDLMDLYGRFEKKIHDLELTRTISLQMGPQIRMIQSNDIQMSEKIQSTMVNTIPLWKSQMVLAVGITHSQEAAKAHRQVTDMTNELLTRNAETLKMATIDTAKEVERGIVDIETLKKTNENLISTLDEVLKIQEEGRTGRRNAENELRKIENELKDTLMGLAKSENDKAVSGKEE